MRCLPLFALCLSQILGNISPVLKEFPASSQEITQFTQNSLNIFEKEYASLLSNIHQINKFSELFNAWNDIIYPLFQTGVVLTFLPLITDEQEVLTKAIAGSLSIQKKAQTAMGSPEILSSVLSFAKTPQKQKTLTPYERYCLYKILQSLPIGEEATIAKKNLLGYPMQPFLYARGDLAEKTLPKERSISCMSWNVCLFDGNLSMLFGGVLPWQSRINQITNKIIELNPDILCLQEVFSSNANLVLVQKLRKYYAHFYYKMGPNPAGFSTNSLGIPSGLFIASKYPLQNERFTGYAPDETPSYRAYGFFSADIFHQKKCIGHLVTTHLQPGYTEIDKDFRKKQLTAISESLPKNTPTLLCGDLNIVKESEEAKNAFSSYESISYEGLNWTCCELRDYWWKAKQNLTTFLDLSPTKEWLDYFLFIPKNKPLSCKAKVFCVNDLERPESALSDHQILMTNFCFD
jgi:endonuclease/exonuclease/phosphatase family metal-dependent hydrolase